MYTNVPNAMKQPAFELPALPFDEDALEPVISGRTIATHYGEHHRAYVDKLNDLVRDDELAFAPLDELVRKTAQLPSRRNVFNAASQAWNHHFYWRSLAPRSGRLPKALLARVNRDFGGYEQFVDGFIAACVGQFGSGWAWLVLEGGKLEITTTSNADSPIVHGIPPLLTVDVWEHAYYLDYQHQRETYARKVIETRLNWDFAAQNLRDQ
jgi:Fe-Mn family superoxide dismutase